MQDICESKQMRYRNIERLITYNDDPSSCLHGNEYKEFLD